MELRNNGTEKAEQLSLLVGTLIHEDRTDKNADRKALETNNKFVNSLTALDVRIDVDITISQQAIYIRLLGKTGEIILRSPHWNSA